MVEKVIATIKSAVRMVFADEYARADALGHDPFKGHTPETNTPGKSYFDSTYDLGYVGWDGGPCNADTGMAAEIGFRSVSDTTVGKVRLVVGEIIPTKMVEETTGGRGFIRDATPKEAEKGLYCGYNVTTKEPNGALEVRRIHGSLQLCVPSDELEYSEVETRRLTVVLTDEPGIGFVVASCHPGEPGPDVESWIKTVRHEADDPDDEPLVGYSEGDVIRQYELVDKVPEGIFDHLVGV